MTDLMIERNDRTFVVRAATKDDVDLVVDVINAAAIEDSGMVATNRREMLIKWGLPQFCLETDTLLVLASEDQAVGYAELWTGKPFVRAYLWGHVHPDHRGQGIGNYLMAWGEERARQSMDKAPLQARVSVHTSTLHANEAAHELFRMRDYALSRHMLKMLIEMVPGTPPPAPIWPEGVGIRTYVRGQDDHVVHKALNEAFRDHWGYVEGETFDEWVHWIDSDPKFDPSVCFLSTVHDNGLEQVVGALMARMEWEKDPDIAWVDELGVLRPWRRKGVALALLQQLFGEVYRRGKYKVGLGVDGASLTGATRLYEKAGMHAFRQLDAYEKVLRPGEDLSVQTLET